MSVPAFNKAAFVEQILAHSRRTPGFIAWHIGEIARPYYTIPDEMADPHEWRKSFLHEAARALNPAKAKGLVDSQPVYMGQLSPIEGPLFSSALHGHLTDKSAVAIEGYLAGREVYRPGEQQWKNIHFSTDNPRWAPGLGKKELFELFRANSFMDNRVLMHLTSIYLYLNDHEPQVASTFRFSLGPPNPQEDITEILAPHSKDLEHWKPDGPETLSTVHIKREKKTLRLFYFGRPLKVPVIKNIYKKINNLGQGVEFW
jgi:hypothetical protein